MNRHSWSLLCWRFAERVDSDISAWQGEDAKRRPTFLEVTKRDGDRLQRARYFVDGKRLQAQLRGNDSGILDQTLAVPESFAMLSPASLSQAWIVPGARVAYVAQADSDRPLGLLRRVSRDAGWDEDVSVPAGSFRARHVGSPGEAGGAEMWLDETAGVPVKVRRVDVETVLVELAR